MLPVTILTGFAVLYLSAKLMEHKVPFYLAALVFVLGTFFLESLMVLFKIGPIPFGGLLVQYIVALPIFYILDQFEDTIANWLITYGIGGIILVYFL